MYITYIAIGLVLFFSLTDMVSAGDFEKPEECVILLHGLGRTSNSMNEMAEALEKAGYYTVNLDYPSQDDRVEKLAVSVIPGGRDECDERNVTSINFVTHSMGGILLRYYLSGHQIENLGRVVMLSPPNQGSEVAETMKNWGIYKWLNGPAGQQLGTGQDSLVLQLGPVDYPVGILVGNEPAFFDFWLEDMIPGPGDGKVSVERAKVEGMRDFLVVPSSHTFIMEEQEVIEQTIHFLHHERFIHPPIGRE